MKKQLGFIVYVFTMFFYSLVAQNSHQDHVVLQWYTKGVSAFEEENYILAKTYFNHLETNAYQVKTSTVYQLLISLMLKENNAEEKTIQFLETHPNSIHSTTLTLALANYFFNKKQTQTALKWFDTIDVKALSTEQETNYHYKLAFANYKAASYGEAKQHLLALSQTGAYKEESHYYLANIAVQTQDYDTALHYFNSIKGVSKFKKEIDYQTLVILYQKKEYKKVVQLGKQIFNNAIGFEKSEMAKIIGESYFYLEEYDQAIKYLSLFKGRNQRYTETDSYFLGYAYYQEENYGLAIENFNKITTQKSKVVQHAHYYLADCYLKLNKKYQALNAFKNASEMNFDTDIQQDAYLNYAKLSYDIGNPYRSSSEVLQDFVNVYPNAVETTEIKGLIINAYLQFKDYDGAIAYYKNQNILKDNQYQQVLLAKGLELFVDYQYKDALTYFTEVSNLYKSETTRTRALFWKAETFMELDNFEEASYYYASFLKKNNSKELDEYSEALYGYSYSLFQQKKYTEALRYYTTYLTTNDADIYKKNNTLLRIADCHYVSKDYWKALENYNKVIAAKGSQADYAMYQKALSYGFLGRNEQKINALKELQKNFKRSTYLDDSYSQLGALYARQNKEDLALKAYDVLLEEYPKSPLVAKTMLKKGLIYFNAEQNQNAIRVLKKVVHKYPGTSEAVQSVKIAEQIYKEIDQVDVYAKWVKKLDFVNVLDLDIDKTMFEAVESRYLQNKWEATIASGKKYLENFPNGVHALVVHYYLGESYYAFNQKQKAIPHYKSVLEKNTNEYTEVSVNKLSQIYLENKQWNLASPLLQKLEKEAVNDQSVIYAQSNLMKYYFINKKYLQVLEYTSKVLENTKSSEQAIQDAYIFGARSAVVLKQLDKAKEYYKELETLGKGEVLAEASYYKAFWLFLEKEHEQSNEQVEVLANQYQNYKYWGVKGLLLMAQNFHELKDNFQAIFILKNVIENAQEFSDVIQEATLLKEKYEPETTLEKEEKKTTTEN